MKFNVIKVHGSNNDFYLIDEMSGELPITEQDRSALSIAVCKRSGEDGADGILFVQASHTADAKMRVFNADGTEASMCGNGLRCVGRYVSEKLGKEELLIETMKADLAVKKEPEIYQDIPTYRVEISPVLKSTKDLPMNTEMDEIIHERLPFLDEELIFTTLSVPNPHLVTIVSKDVLASDKQEKLAKYVNGENTWFPDGVNVSFINLLGDNDIFVRTYERGVGFTNACGTAMSASSLVTKWEKNMEDEVLLNVYNPGGMVKCHVHDLPEKIWIDLIGNATYEYKQTLEADLQHKTVQFGTKETFEDEEKAYDAFISYVKGIVGAI
ncbi:diaminopimelate epimerase [Pradoshia sp.]